MYAEQFGIQNPSPAVEAAAKWVQWAQTGIMAGALENEATIRYNLNQFWLAKAPAYNAGTATDRVNLDKLDTYAHGLWGALEGAKIYGSTPSYWQYWKSYMLGFVGVSSVPSNPDSYAAATAAAAAAEGQKQAAQRVAQESPAQAPFAAAMTDYATAQQKLIPQDVAKAGSIWGTVGSDFLGIPVWGWLALGGVILLMTWDR